MNDTVDTVESTTPSSLFSSSSSFVYSSDDGDESNGDDEEEEENEVKILRRTIRVMNRVIESSESQFSGMADEIVSLESKLKRSRDDFEKSSDDVNIEKEGEEEEEGDNVGQYPRIKQKEDSDMAVCNKCFSLLTLDCFGKTSMRKRIGTNKATVKVYEYRRQICKECDRNTRRERIKQIKTI